MTINMQTLKGVFVGFNTLFTKAFTDVTPTYTQVATVVPSTTESETYAWLGDMPGMREWIGEREINNLSSAAYTLKNKDFESTISIERNKIEDDKIGLFSPAVQMLGHTAARHPDSLVFGLLKKGFTEKCYDDEAFFSTTHKVGDKKVSNKGTAKLSQDSFITARAAIMSMKNTKGASLNLMPNLLVVPPALEGEARKILIADQIDGTSNMTKGMAEILVVPELAGTDSAWYLLCTQAPLRPLIFQERTKPKLIAKTNETDNNLFYHKEYVYGVDYRGNAGFGFWQMAYGSTGTTA